MSSPSGPTPPHPDSWEPGASPQPHDTAEQSALAAHRPGPSQPPRKNNRLPLLITAVVLVIALAATGIVYLAQRSSNIAAGASSPVGAVENLVTAMNDNDPLGIVEVLDPIEATQATYLSETIVSDLKRLNILAADTEVNDTLGVAISLTDVTYGETSPVTDQVTVVEVTGGMLTIEANPDQLPLSDKIRAALPAEATATVVERETIDLADARHDTGEPLRIAAINRGGNWYPSMMYSIFDSIAVVEFGTDYPQHPAFTAIPALGADSPEAAMTAFIDAMGSADADKIVGLLAPEEMGALHDYVNLLSSDSDISQASDDIFSLAGISLTDTEWAVSDAVSTRDGAKVSFKSFTITSEGQEPVTVTRDIDAGTLSVSVPGEPTLTYSSEMIIDLVESGFESVLSLGSEFAAGFDTESNFDSDVDSNASVMGMSPEVRDIIERVYRTLIDAGIVMTQAEDGLWYVNPAGSVTEIFVALLQALEPADIDYFLSLTDE